MLKPSGSTRKQRLFPPSRGRNEVGTEVGTRETRGCTHVPTCTLASKTFQHPRTLFLFQREQREQGYKAYSEGLLVFLPPFLPLARREQAGRCRRVTSRAPAVGL